MTRKRPGTTATATLPPPRPPVSSPPFARLAFRFTVVYLGLFALATQISGSMLPNPVYYYRGLGRIWPMRDITVWAGDWLFGVTLSPQDATVSGEPLFFWVQTSWLLIAAAGAAIAWTLADRGRRSDAAVGKWFRVFARVALAAALFEYGMTKVIPTQFPAPSLETLVTRVGDLTLSGLLWASIGASPAYEIFTGCVEVLAGILLLFQRTTLLGALLGLAAMTQVFALNVTYDVGLKLVSFHLMLFAAFLLAPDAPRLADVFLRDRPAASSTQLPLAHTPRGRRLALAAQLAAGAYLLGMYTYINVAFWHMGGGGAPKSPLYGIWSVQTLSINGEVRPPELNDYDRRWQHVIFDDPGRIVFQRTDDSFARYGAAIDTGTRTIDLTKGDSRTWRSTFRFDRPSEDYLVLEGRMDGHEIDLVLRRVEFETLRLLNSTFRWVREQ